MKSKLKVRRIVDSFLSKDDVGFYKIEWEESWLPVDAFQHLKYLIEEFWKHKKASEETSTLDAKPSESEENINTDKLTDECTTVVSPTNGDTKNENDDNISSTSKGETTVETSEENKEKSVETVEKSSCYFCGRLVGLSDLNSHEHEHIQQNCSDALINLIGECQNENVFLVNINGERSLPNKEVSTLNVIPPNGSTDNLVLSNTNKSTSSNYTLHNNNKNDDEVSPTMTIHHRSDRSTGLSCPVCSQSFNLFNEFLVHFQTHRNTSRYFYCEECGKQFLSKELFEKHTQLHIDANRRQKSYGSKISSVKSSRKTIRRIIYPRLYQPSDNNDSYHVSKDQLIDLSESPFGSMSGQHGSSSGENSDETKMFVEMLETNRYRKRTRKDAAEFSPDVLRSARQYIKAVSKRRKIIKRSRLQAQEKQQKDNKSSDVNSLVDGIGVDVELERSEDSLPILSFVAGKKAYSCKICNKTFFNKFHHREHYNVHSGEMPYECEFCLKRFAQRSGWNRHIKLHHKYDVFAGPLPRFSADKQNEKLMTSLPCIMTPTLGNPRLIAPKVIECSIPTYNPKEVQCETVVANPPTIPPSTTEADPVSPSPISELARLAYDIHPPTLVPSLSTPHPSSHPSLLPPHPVSLPTTQTPSHTPVISPIQATLPTSHPPEFQSRFGRLPDAVKRAMQAGITPPSFSDATTSQHTTISQQIPKKNHASGAEKTTAFQCKKVRTMNGDLIFMIRVSAKTGSAAPNKEFAYILDDAGFVESRIFVDDYPGGDWLDFPLDETANDVLRSRVHDYDEQNRRGPKPAHLAANRKLSKGEIDKDPVSDAGKNLFKVCRPPVSTKDIIASSLVYTTTAAGDSSTTIKSTHGRSFRSGREKRFSCHICERKFLAQAHLNDHMLIHTGELPYKCMFCNRPFRHKSGLNSHHKRHIQRGVFNRPISSKDKIINPTAEKTNKTEVAIQQANSIQEVSTSQMGNETYPNYINSGQLGDNMPHDPYTSQYSYVGMKDTQADNTPIVPMKDTSEKPKRKGRKPKQVRKSPVSVYFNGEENLTTQQSSELIPKVVKNESNDDVYQCNFCSLTFPMRTAYLKHVHRMHKASNTVDVNIGEFDPEENMFSEFDETMIKQEVFESPVEMEDGLNNGVVENLFPDVTIKEEEIDEEYLQ